MARVHVVPGDSAASALRLALADAADETVVGLSDALSCGPLCNASNLEEWASLRRRFWAEVLQGGVAEFAVLPDPALLRDATTITLWLGNGVRDQLTLPWLCWLGGMLEIHWDRLRVVQFPRDFVPRHRTPSLAMLSPDLIRKGAKERTLGPQETDALRRAWLALTSGDPSDLCSLASQPEPSPLRSALACLAWRYPSAENGLAHWDQMLLLNARDHGPRVPYVLDLSFPPGTSRLDEVPGDFDCKRQPTRLDEVAAALQQHSLPRNVTDVKSGPCGSFSLAFEGSLTLEVFPDAAVESESWRLFVPGDVDRDHLVDESVTHAAVVPGVSASLDPASRATLYTHARASIRFMGDSLDPLDVTRLIRLPYDHAHRAGEPTVRRRSTDLSVNEYAPYRSGMWSMSSEPWIRSSDLDVHVSWLLEQLEPRADQVKQVLSNGVVGDIFCFSSGPPPHPPTLPKRTLERAAALGLTIDIDYYGDDEPSEPPKAV